MQQTTAPAPQMPDPQAPDPQAPHPQTGSGSLIAFRWDRLGARLITIVNTLRIAGDHGLPFRICWPQASGMGAELNDVAELFAPDFIARHVADQTALGERRRAAVKLTRMDVAPGELARLLASGQDVAVEMVTGVACLPGEDPDEVARRCGAVFRALPWAAALGPTMARLDAGLRGGTALHIRRGDTVRYFKAMQKPWPNKYVPEELFHPHIAAALGEGRPVLVFSDDAHLVARLRRDHPGLQAASDLLPDGGLTPAQRDLLELYAMSLCDPIVAPEGSAFSTTAATLGGRRMLDVKADLPAEARDAAHAALLERMRHRPDSFDGPGDMGQCVPHLVDWLTAAGRGAEAARLCGDLTVGRIGGPAAGGLGISFVTGLAAKLGFEHEGPEAVLALGPAVARRPPFRDRDLVAVRLTQAAAHALTGDGRAARWALLNAFAHDPVNGTLRRVLPILARGGALTAEAFLPNDPAAFDLTGARLGRGGANSVQRALASLLPDPDAPQPATGLPDPFWVDWGPFLPAPGLVQERVLGRDGGLSAALARVMRDDAAATPRLRALHALLRAHAGEVAEALAELAPLAAAHPDDALILHRASHAHLIARDVDAAATAALAAVAACDSPFHHGWAGFVLQRRRRRRAEAAAHLRTAVAADTGLPALPLLLAALERRRERTDAAMAALAEAERLAPNLHTPVVDRAEMLFAAGDLEAARAALMPMVVQDRAPLSGWRLLAEIERAAGRGAAARDAVAEGLLRKPDDARLLALADRLG